MIAQVLDSAEALVWSLRAGVKVPGSLVGGAVAFFTAFVGRHDNKEEQALFPAMMRHRESEALDFAGLRIEHEEGRRLLRALDATALHRKTDGDVLGLLEAYVALLRRHMAAEDGMVFPMADGLLSPDDDARVRQGFDRLDEQAGGQESVGALLALGGSVAEASRALGSHASARPGEALAEHIMRRRTGVVAPEDSLARALARMESLGAREVPVVAGDAVVGIITRADLEPHRGHYEWTLVRTAMTPDPVVIEPRTPTAEVARTLRQRELNAVPVVDAGRLVGMVRRADLLELLLEPRRPQSR